MIQLAAQATHVDLDRVRGQRLVPFEHLVDEHAGADVSTGPTNRRLEKTEFAARQLQPSSSQVDRAIVRIEEAMKLWTVSADYYATGEGRTQFGWIGYAENRDDALDRFGDAFDGYFARAAVAAEGVVENEVIRDLFSPAALSEVRRLNGRGKVELVGSLHFNLA